MVYVPVELHRFMLTDVPITSKRKDIGDNTASVRTWGGGMFGHLGESRWTGEWVNRWSQCFRSVSPPTLPVVKVSLHTAHTDPVLTVHWTLFDVVKPPDIEWRAGDASCSPARRTWHCGCLWKGEYATCPWPLERSESDISSSRTTSLVKSSLVMNLAAF